MVYIHKKDFRNVLVILWPKSWEILTFLKLKILYAQEYTIKTTVIESTNVQKELKFVDFITDLQLHYQKPHWFANISDGPTKIAKNKGIFNTLEWIID